VQFAGGGAVGGGGRGGKQFGEQGDHIGRPVGMMIAPGKSGRPGLRAALGAGPQVEAVEFVEAGAGQGQFAGGGVGTDLAGAVAGQNVADERSGQAFDQLGFFIAARMSKEDGFFALKLMPAGASRAAWEGRPTCRVSDFRRRSGCVPAEPYPPLKHPGGCRVGAPKQRQTYEPDHYSPFDRTALSPFDRTTTAGSGRRGDSMPPAPFPFLPTRTLFPSLRQLWTTNFLPRTRLRHRPRRSRR
jgi:hypothetical protein